jgi:glucose/arabinose dehydrogenase
LRLLWQNHLTEEIALIRAAALVAISLILSLSVACSQQGTTAVAEPARTTTSANAKPGSDCSPVESRSPNSPDQRPTFAGQTRACAEPTGVAFDVVVLAKGLRNPWAVEPLPDGSLLVTEKPGRMRIVSATGTVGAPIAGVPAVDDDGQGGLLDVALSPSFANDRTIYWSYSEPRGDGANATSVARGVLSPDRTRLEGVKVIFRALPAYGGAAHFGSRLAFGPDGMLFITLGERSDRSMRPQAQKLDSHMGKVIRIAADGSVPRDNPFVGRAGALPEIWTLGHRNVQSAAFDAEGRFWAVEHGARGGDELNLIQKAKNYGWPLITFGEEYSSFAISDETTRSGFEDPVYYWDPVIAPSGLQFHSGRGFPAWRGSLFIGALREQRLVRLSLKNGRVAGEEHLLTDRGQRIRDVREGADGSLYIVTDEDDGELWKISPKK